ncbi:LptF/LptG family permease [Acetobacter sp. AN02]|uniref:LptF/LptG family permease n=1 Tax=Acetobacter sp. AN02 TaxID=2894186 RepID=UPI00243442AD|nr:LptF/LptG family permease [Acetobacter sp. AN02]MDG6094252.1 LptF/LptG family permease [Acetobacter sp. AN02]
MSHSSAPGTPVDTRIIPQAPPPHHDRLLRLFRILPRPLRPRLMDVYIFEQLVPPFFITVLVVLLALLMERMLVLMNLLAQEASPLSTFVRLLANLLPHYLGLALPAALCVAVFSVTRKMSENNEIDALMASGVSIGRFTVPFVVAGILLGLFSMLLYGYIQPHARYQFRSGFYYASHAGWSPVLQPGVMATPTSSLSLMARQVDHTGSVLHDVFIRDTSGDEERDISAKEGRILSDLLNGEVQIRLSQGLILTRPHTGIPNVTRFDQATRLITRAAAPAFRERGYDERELTSGQLAYYLARNEPAPQDISLADMRAELHFRLSRSVSTPFIVFLAAGLAIIGKRKRGNTALAVAALLLVSYDHVGKLGESLIATGKGSPLWALWMPTAVFCAGSLLLMLVRGNMLRLLPRRRRPVSARASGAASS